MHIEYGKKHDEWRYQTPQNSHYFSLIDDDDDIVMVDEAFCLHHAWSCAIRAAATIGCDVFCNDCHRRPGACECIEEEEMRRYLADLPDLPT